MKRLVLMILAFAIFLVPAACAEQTEPEEITEDAAGTVQMLVGMWYADLNGIPAEMELAEGGNYTMTISGNEPQTGSWELSEGFLFLDGSAEPDFSVTGDVLFWYEAYTIFTREPIQPCTPGAVLTNVPADCFGGYWKCQYVDVEGRAFPASAVSDRTDLYVEGTTVILGGPEFLDAQVKMEEKDGMLSCAVDGASVRLQLQEDGYLRLTLTLDGDELIWYLLPAYSAAL